MKIPSIQYLSERAGRSFSRFPLTVVSASLGVLCGIYLVEFENEIDAIPFVNLLLTCALGIPLFFSTAVIIEKYRLGSAYQALVIFISLGTLVLIHFSLPDSSSTQNVSVPYIRYVIFNLIFHLLVSYTPFLKNRSTTGFWNYNKFLFIRFWQSAFYSGSLFAGLSLAYVALDLLFDVKIKDELYLNTFIVIAGLFNTWFFVSGIPSDLEELEEQQQYPKGLKIFTQYILIPLLTLYLVILYAYGFKIIFQWELPKGIIAYLISIVSTLGILTLLLIYPYIDSGENKWIKKFNNIYYYVLVPLIALLFIAIYLRIGQYGITINRYIIVLLGVWLLTVSVYFITRNNNIKFIPVTLTIFLLLMSFGPWSMFSVSERSQVNRLHDILESAGIISDGQILNEVVWVADSLPVMYSENILTNNTKLSDSLHNEVMSIMDYLDDNHGFDKFQDTFKQDMDSIVAAVITASRHTNESDIYMKTLGLVNSYKYYNETDQAWKYHATYESGKNLLTDLRNHDYLYPLELDLLDTNVYTATFEIYGHSASMTYDGSEEDLILFLINNDSVIIDLHPVITRLDESYGRDLHSGIEQNEMKLTESSYEYEVTIVVQKVAVRKKKEKLRGQDVTGLIYFKRLNALLRDGL